MGKKKAFTVRDLLQQIKERMAAPCLPLRDGMKTETERMDTVFHYRQFNITGEVKMSPERTAVGTIYLDGSWMKPGAFSRAPILVIEFPARDEQAFIDMGALIGAIVHVGESVLTDNSARITY